jgi:hypothetical protein
VLIMTTNDPTEQIRALVASGAAAPATAAASPELPDRTVQGPPPRRPSIEPAQTTSSPVAPRDAVALDDAPPAKPLKTDPIEEAPMTPAPTTAARPASSRRPSLVDDGYNINYMIKLNRRQRELVDAVAASAGHRVGGVSVIRALLDYVESNTDLRQIIVGQREGAR